MKNPIISILKLSPLKSNKKEWNKRFENIK